MATSSVTSVQRQFTGTAPQKPVGRYTLVGARVPARRYPGQIAAATRCASPAHAQHAARRVVLPRGSAPTAPAPALSIDEARSKDIPSARVIRKATSSCGADRSGMQ